jgi:hypothetical protein
MTSTLRAIMEKMDNMQEQIDGSYKDRDENSRKE